MTVLRNNISMRGRVILWISLGLNIALTAVVLYFPPVPPETRLTTTIAPAPADPARVYKTNVVVRRQNFVWNQIESDDYATYIANLRAVGCPEATIRDIIVADVNQLYARRRATEIVTAEQQWWRSEPDPDVTQGALDNLRLLDAERRGLLTRLLGRDWESADYPHPAYSSAIPLDGPILGGLSIETKVAIQHVERASTERRQAYLEAMRREGKPADPAELARLRQLTRNELALVLNPKQLEEYVLRYSNNANQLRAELRGFNATPDEFRTLFHACDPLDQQLQLLANNTDPDAVKRRQELEQQRIQVIQETLGEERFEDYKLNQDPIYRQAQAVAQQVEAPAEKLVPIYAITQATEQERQRIRNDATMTSAEKTEALETVQIVHLNSLRRLLGEEAYQRYLKNLNQ